MTSKLIDNKEKLNQCLINSKQIIAVGNKKKKNRSLYKCTNIMFCIALGGIIGAVGSRYIANQNIGENLPSSPIIQNAHNAFILETQPGPWFRYLINNKDKDKTNLYVFDDIKKLFIQRKINPNQALSIILNMQRANNKIFFSSEYNKYVNKMIKQQQKSKLLLSNVWFNPTHDNWKKIENSHVVKKFIKHQFYAVNHWDSLSEDQKWSVVETHWDRRVLTAHKLSRKFKNNHYSYTLKQNKKYKNNDISKMDAYKNLKESVKKSGLFALVVPFQISQNASEINALANKIKNSNKELQNITGWSDGVLGLNKRVILNPTAVLVTGRTYIGKEGFIHIKAWWNTLSHEWFHALDLSLSEYAAKYPAKLLSKQIQLQEVSSIYSSSNINYYSTKGVIETKNMDDFNIEKINGSIIKEKRLKNTHFLQEHKNSYPVSFSINKINIQKSELLLWNNIVHPKLNNNQLLQIEDVASVRLKHLSSSDGSVMFDAIRLTDVVIGNIYKDKEANKSFISKINIKNASPWLYWRSTAENNVKKYDKFAYIFNTSDEKYLSSPSEILAFSFAAHTSVVLRENNNKNPHMILNDTRFGFTTSLTYKPSIIEAKAKINTWNGFFESLHLWWKHDKEIRINHIDKKEQKLFTTSTATKNKNKHI